MELPKVEQERPKLRLLTTAEAAVLLRLSESALQGFRCRGGGPPYLKLGRGRTSKVVYRESDLLEWLSQQEWSETSEYGVRRR